MHKMRRISVAASFLALACLAALPAAAQEWAGQGRLQGQIKDEQGKPVAGATITLRPGTDRVDAKKPGPAQITTDKNGKWSVLGLAGGPWGILIEKEGFMLSEGQVKVGGPGSPPAPPINVTLKVIPKEVIEQAERESTAGQAKAALERGNALLNEKKWAEARAEYEGAMAKLEDQQFHPMILRAIANTYYQEGKVNEAIATLQKALALKPDDVDTLKLTADLLIAAGREAEAQQYMAKLPAGTKMDPNSVLNLGIKAFNDGKMDDALARFEQVVKENPDLPDGYYYRGLVYLNKGRNAEAKADFQKLLQLAPDHRYAAEAKEFLKELAKS
jgi:tetratricopeptide (TPR) repeat protein